MVDIWLRNRHLIDRAKSWIYPAQCVLCAGFGEADQDLCSGCRLDLPWNRHACPRCALPLPAGAPLTVCARCQQAAPPFDTAWAPFEYVTAIRWLHRRLKFGGRLGPLRVLGNLLAGALGGALALGTAPRPDLVLVAPLHAGRLWSRGFNQSLELLRPAARRFDLQLDVSALRRQRATRPQSGLPAGARRRNVRGAFVCVRDLSDQRVALFDDVITTGETAAEMARVLRRAGAREISVWCLARTPRQPD